MVGARLFVGVAEGNPVGDSVGANGCGVSSGRSTGAEVILGVVGVDGVVFGAGVILGTVGVDGVAFGAGVTLGAVGFDGAAFGAGVAPGVIGGEPDGIVACRPREERKFVRND